MSWIISPNVESHFQGIHKIHPLKQRSVELLLREVERYPSIEIVGIFGSATEDRCTEFSDFDVVMKGAKFCTFIPPDCDDFDIIFGEDISKTSSIWDEIERDGVCVYRKNSIKDS